MVLDRLLPNRDGLAVLTEARVTGLATPVIMLTALGQIADRVEGLSAEADDYLIKPFSFDNSSPRSRPSRAATGRTRPPVACDWAASTWTCCTARCASLAAW
ncbi:response regulator [Sphingomonas sp.]|uniref:response regulator n=1 Tax=Sphingomonas sp. TaxID=28214 RepID=UPI003AFF7941